MKNLLLGSLAMVAAVSLLGCADDTATTRTTYRQDRLESSDPKDMSPRTVTTTTTTTDMTTVDERQRHAEYESESGDGINSSGNLNGAR